MQTWENKEEAKPPLLFYLNLHANSFVNLPYYIKGNILSNHPKHRTYTIHTTKYKAEGTEVGLSFDPDDIHVMEEW